MSLTVPSALLEQAKQGTITEEDFLDCIPELSSVRMVRRSRNRREAKRQRRGRRDQKSE